MRATASQVSIPHYRQSRAEYDRPVEAGAFEPTAKLQLIDRNLHVMTPEGVSHTISIELRRTRDSLTGGLAHPRSATG